MKHIESDKLGTKYDKMSILWNIPRNTTYTILLNKIVCFEAWNFLREIVSHIESSGSIIYNLMKVQDSQIEADEPIKPTTIELADSTDELPIIQAPRKSIRVELKWEYSSKIDGDQM